jgi:hypothetical protein
MIVAFKRYDSQALMTDKIVESSGEKDEKVGDIPFPPQTTHKNKFEPLFLATLLKIGTRTLG